MAESGGEEVAIVDEKCLKVGDRMVFAVELMRQIVVEAELKEERSTLVEVADVVTGDDGLKTLWMKRVG